ncbi:MAG: FAD-binding oxidoreductase [Burkholderiales bacterium]
MSSHEARVARLRAELRSGAAGVGLAKKTSNLFRDRAPSARPRVDLSGFNEVIEVDAVNNRVVAEGMTPYESLVDATLAHGTMPCVVPQLKSITLGGAAAGVGIEASSFRYGLVHDTLAALDVLLADGSIVTCTPDNEHRDLFYGFPNSYGTLGYALKVTARTVPVKRFVRIEHIRHSDAARYFGDLEARCRERGADAPDFVDGTVFSGREMFITLGRFTDTAPFASDYGYKRIYYRSIRERDTDYLTTKDFIWRWDTDWFWCSKNLYAQNPVVRRLLGRKRLNSVTYAKIMRWNSRWGVTRALDRLAGRHPESVIQDVDIPIARAAGFLDFLLREIGILPVWICPVRAHDPNARFPLYPIDPHTLYVNFGFWDVVRSTEPHEPGYYNRKIERKVAELGGIKSLYSDSFYPEDEFWRIYNGPAYEALKARYDPENKFKDLYRKCVLRH